MKLREILEGLQQQMNLMRDEMGQMRGEMGQMRGDMQHLRVENLAMHQETRRHFDVFGEHIDSRIDLLAEGILNTNERIDRLDDKVEVYHRETKDEFDSVRALIKYSYDQLQ